MKMQASIEFLLVLSAIAALSLSVISLYGKQLFAETGAFAEVANASQANISLSNYTLPYYSQAEQEAYSAEIVGRNERLAYVISQPSNITNLTERSHCTYYGTYYPPPGIGEQCGTYNAWYYLAANSLCPDSSAYCIFANDTGYAVENAGPARNYIYNFTLEISAQGDRMLAYLQSGQNESPLMLGNTTVGYARVVDVSSGEPGLSLSLISYGGTYSLLNESLYGQYAQSESLAYPVLSYYNGSEVDSDTQATIQEAVYSFTKASKELRYGPALHAQCDVAGSQYVCNATYPFFYVIDANVSGGLGIQNETLYYLGSVIRVYA